MIKYVFKRLLMMIPVLLGVSLLIFTMLYFTPGDPAKQLLGEQASIEEIEQLREEMGLNDSYIMQYATYMKNLIVNHDMGLSYSTRQPVINELLERFPATLLLAALSMLLATFIGIIAGIIAATRQYSIFDYFATMLSMLGVSMPNFWQGLMLILLFSVHLGWFPSSGFSGPMYWVLPVLTVGTSAASSIMRMTRSSVLEVIRADYIRTARSKGISEKVVIFKHVLKNSLITVITVVGLSFGSMLGGAVLTESIFGIPGLGKLMLEAIKARNYPVVQGGVLFIAVVFGFVNLTVDLLYAFVDPRIKSQYRGAKKKKREAIQ